MARCNSCRHLLVHERAGEVVVKCKFYHKTIGFFRWLIGCKNCTKK